MNFLLNLIHTVDNTLASIWSPIANALDKASAYIVSAEAKVVRAVPFSDNIASLVSTDSGVSDKPVLVKVKTNRDYVVDYALASSEAERSEALSHLPSFYPIA